ncbi:glycosyltransferase [Fusobacterium polymorphum]|jgi:glycosyltransferase|uniref:glycosyltransferase n=1 Tax=Fusobacterium nucleatum subsp. polymorphum TaxID=76857 RepID=UPI003009FD8F
MKPKILFYTLSTHLGGGIETVTIEYVNDFIKNGYDVDLLVDYDMGEDEKSIEKYMDKNVNIQYLKSVKLSKSIYSFRNKGQKNKIYNLFLYASIILTDFFLWRKEIKKLKKNNYVATITFFQYLPAYITKIKGAKHFIFLHGSVEHFFQGIRKYFKKLFFKKLNKFDYVCTVSEEMLDQLREVFPKLTNKQETIYNPFDYEKIKEKSKDYSELSKEERELITKPYICSVGRINEGQKDFTTLINSYKKLVDENKIEENLVIVGDGPDLELLEEYIKKLKLEQRVFFLGRKNNPYVWIDNCKLFVLSTKFEGFGLVLTESMILNKKVISSNCLVGPKEILENGKYGKLFEIGNVEELSEKILITLGEEEKETEEYVIKKFNTGFKKLLELIKG